MQAKQTKSWDRKMAKKAKDDAKKVDLYSVFAAGTDRKIYPGDGVPRDQAERLSRDLVAETEVRLVKAAE